MASILTNIQNKPSKLVLVYKDLNGGTESIEVNKIKYGKNGLSDVEATIIANKLKPVSGKIDINKLQKNVVVVDTESVYKDGNWLLVQIGVLDGYDRIYYSFENFKGNVSELIENFMAEWTSRFRNRIGIVGYNLPYDIDVEKNFIEKSFLITDSLFVKSRTLKFYEKRFADELYGYASIDMMRISMLMPTVSKSLEMVLRSMGINIHKYDQRQFLEFLERGDEEKIKEHNMNDVVGTYAYYVLFTPLIKFLLENSVGSVSHALNHIKIGRNLLIGSLMESASDNFYKRLDIVYNGLKKHGFLNNVFNKQEIPYKKSAKRRSCSSAYVLLKHLQMLKYIVNGNFKKWGIYYVAKKMDKLAEEIKRMMKYKKRKFAILLALNGIAKQMVKNLLTAGEEWRNLYNNQIPERYRGHLIYDDFDVAFFSRDLPYDYGFEVDYVYSDKTANGTPFYEARYGDVVFATESRFSSDVLLPDHFKKEINKLRIERAKNNGNVAPFRMPELDKYNTTILIKPKNPNEYTNKSSYRARLMKQLFQYGSIDLNEPIPVWLNKNDEVGLEYNDSKIDKERYIENITRALEQYKLPGPQRKITLDTFLR